MGHQYLSRWPRCQRPGPHHNAAAPQERSGPQKGPKALFQPVIEANHRSEPLASFWEIDKQPGQGLSNRPFYQNNQHRTPMSFEAASPKSGEDLPEELTRVISTTQKPRQFFVRIAAVLAALGAALATPRKKVTQQCNLLVGMQLQRGL